MAAFDIKDTINEMLLVLKLHTGDGWKKMRSVAQQFASSNEERLKMLADLLISGELTTDEFLKKMEHEKLMLEAQMNDLEVITKATVQKAVNGAFEVFYKAVGAVIPLV